MWAYHEHCPPETDTTWCLLDTLTYLASTISFILWLALCNPMITATVSHVNITYYCPYKFVNSQKCPTNLTLKTTHMIVCQRAHWHTIIHYTSPEGTWDAASSRRKSWDILLRVAMPIWLSHQPNQSTVLIWGIQLHWLPSTRHTLMTSTVYIHIWMYVYLYLF